MDSMKRTCDFGEAFGERFGGPIGEAVAKRFGFPLGEPFFFAVFM
jgi:hypothetical protein